jgi:hypothetical protein
MRIFPSSICAILAGTSFLLGILPAAAAPPPAIGNPGTSAVIPQLGALHYTTNVATCEAKGGSATICGAIVSKGAVAFFASWNCPSCSVSGFKLRRVGAPADPRVLVRLGAGGGALDDQGQPLFIESPPSDGWIGQCFVVVAYKNPTQILQPNGAGGMRPTGQTTGTYQESTPSAQTCVAGTSDHVMIPASAERGYTRIYSILYNRDNKQTFQDLPPVTSGELNIGLEFRPIANWSQTNTFFRSVFEFDRTALGDATIFGGWLAYDTPGGSGCATLYSPAPSGWQGATWITRTGKALSLNLPQGGIGAQIPVDSTVRAWNGKTITFQFDPGSSPESIQSGAEPMMTTCLGHLSNVRLILTVGITK